MVQSALETSVGHLAGVRLLATLRRRRQQLERARCLFTVIALLRQHCFIGDLVNLLRAFGLGLYGLLFPSLVKAVPELLSHNPPKFQACELHVNPHNRAETMTIGPHCQCRARMENVRVRSGVADSPKVVLAGKTVQVPRWVTAADGRGVRGGGEVYWRPRYVSFPRSEVAQSGDRMFRARLTSLHSRCQVLFVVYDVHLQMDEAFTSGLSFLDTLHGEMEAILGAVGTNDGMKVLLSAIASCWDWS